MERGREGGEENGDRGGEMREGMRMERGRWEENGEMERGREGNKEEKTAS